MSYVTIEAAVLAKLQSVTELQEVFDYHTTNLPGFPAATMEPSDGEDEMLTTVDNLRHYSFDIVVHQEMTVAGRQEAKNILMAAVDAIITAFDEDWSLGGAVQEVIPLPSKWGTYEAGNASVMFATLQVKCMKVVQVG